MSHVILFLLLTSFFQQTDARDPYNTQISSEATEITLSYMKVILAITQC